MRWFSAAAAFLAIGVASLAQAQQPLVIHEWGTFTSFQNETGRALSRVNSDDEPVPEFVHRVGTISPSLSDNGGKGIMPSHPEVTMRLETPVLYFHLPQGVHEQTIKVAVQFHGGWLTEYFPNAASQSISITDHLTQKTIGELKWITSKSARKAADRKRIPLCGPRRAMFKATAST